MLKTTDLERPLKHDLMRQLFHLLRTNLVLHAHKLEGHTQVPFRDFLGLDPLWASLLLPVILRDNQKVINKNNSDFCTFSS